MRGRTSLGVIALALFVGLASARESRAAPAPTHGTVETLLPELRLIRGAVNTAVFERNGRLLLIDPGELAGAPGGLPVDWVLVTHHHRDQAAQVGRLVAAGARLVVPAAEERLFSDARGFWRAQNHYWTSFRPSRFSLREDVAVARAVRDGDRLEWEGLTFTVLETPGHTDGSVTYVVEVDGRRIAFTGDLIYGPGQLWDLHSLQNRFGLMTTPHKGFGGDGERLFASLGRVLAVEPDWLVPSHGVVMTEPPAAVAETRRNFDAVMDNYLTTVGWPDFGQSRLAPNRPSSDGLLEKLYPDKNLPRLPRLPPAAYPPWIRDVTWTTQAIVADNGAAFLSDCGKSGNMDVVAKIGELIRAGEIRRVEGLWPTHYHVDHSELLNRMREATGALVYVQREMLDITENPFAYGLAYMSSVPTPVDQVMEHGQTIDWHGIKLTFYHFPGQTLYHGGLLAEKDGFKAFFTGDSWANWGLEDYCTHFRCFLGEGRGYEKCLRLLLECKPDILVQAHRGPMAVTEEHLRRTLATFQEREALCRRLLPHSDPNYGLDPYWVRAYPYRQTASPGQEIVVEARITNHDTRPRTVRAELRVPAGWRIVVGEGTATIAARCDGSVRFRAVAPRNPPGSRHVLGIAFDGDGQSWGELAEAIVDVAPD